MREEETKIIKENKRVYWCGCELQGNPEYAWLSINMPHSEETISTPDGLFKRQICEKQEVYRDIPFKKQELL